MYIGRRKSGRRRGRGTREGDEVRKGIEREGR